MSPQTHTVDFKVEELHSPEPNVYGFKLDVMQFAPPNAEVKYVDIAGLEIVRDDTGETHDVVNNEDRNVVIRVHKGGYAHIDYGVRVNDRSAAIAVRATLTDPECMEFAVAIYVHHADQYKLKKVRGTITYLKAEPSDEHAAAGE